MFQIIKFIKFGHFCCKTIFFHEITLYLNMHQETGKFVPELVLLHVVLCSDDISLFMST